MLHFIIEDKLLIFIHTDTTVEILIRIFTIKVFLVYNSVFIRNDLSRFIPLIKGFSLYSFY